MLKLDVAELQVGHNPPTIVDLTSGQVNANKVAARKLHRHRDQVAAGGAAQFQDPTAFNRGRPHLEQLRNRRQPIRMGLGVRVALVRHLVVTAGESGFAVHESVSATAARPLTRRSGAAAIRGRAQVKPPPPPSVLPRLPSLTVKLICSPLPVCLCWVTALMSLSLM